MKTRDKPSASAPLHRNSSFFRTGAGQDHGVDAPFFGLASLIQLKLSMGVPGDRFEQEADSVADRVVKGMESGGINRANATGLQAKCDACREEESKVRRQAATVQEEEPLQAKADTKPTAVPAKAQQALEGHASGGEAMAPALRMVMESSFAADFSGVRIHTGASATDLNRSLNARAFTHGQDVFFNSGEFNPDTRQGRHLLAHELTHVVQQRNGGNRLQREPGKDEAAKPAAKIDVSIVLSDEDQDMAEGRAYASKALRVTDTADAAAQIKGLGVPIGKLFVVSHSSSAGQVQFSSSIGTVSWVPIADLAKALKGAATIDEVDFRGCKLGNAAGAMESFRRTVGAQSTKGSNCWTFIQHVTPLTLDGVPVTNPNQIPKGRQAAFDKALLNQLAGMTSVDGKPVQDCLVGLGRGERANARTLAKIWKLYWANNGNLIASWGSPNYNKDWQQGSICTKDMTADTKPCSVVEVKAPAATAPAGGGKTSMIDDSQSGTEVGIPVTTENDAESEGVG